MQATRERGAAARDAVAGALRAAGVVAALVTAGMFSACVGGIGDGSLSPAINGKPGFVGTVTRTIHDGASDDLLTAGLGKSGLGATAAPAPVNPAAPTAAELRRNVIFANYRAILDISPKGGYGTLYGPNIDVNGNDTLGEGRIAGIEYLAYADDGSGKKDVTMMVQVPASFNQSRPCIITAASSGSRGVYGAIGSAGEWGLKHGCAVAYTDKGTGMGTHDLATNTVNLQDGTRTGVATAGTKSNFTVALGATDLANFNAAYPNRVAFKHAHSQQNPEKDWGNETLHAVRFAFYVLNEQFAPKATDGQTTVKFKADNTIVIASSVSNGGASAIAAAEQDADGLIDGVAVGEPVLEQAANPSLVVRQGGRSLAGGGKALLDYYTLANLYQPCATLSTRAAGSPGLAAILPSPAISANRCAALKAKGLLTAATTAGQAEESMDALLNAGYPPESNVLHASHYPFGISPVVVTFASAYGKFGVADRLCGYSFASTDATGKPTAIAAAQLAQVFANGNGIPPTATINIVNDNNPGGPLLTGSSVSPSTGQQDFNIDGGICHRNLITGNDANAARVQGGIKETLLHANLRGKPALIVAGRADTQVPVPFNARPYFGQNKIVEGAASKLSYIEVQNAQHFDAFIDNAAFPGYDSLYVPLHYYFIQAMDRMWANLTQGTALPPSQVVRTTPRGGVPGSAPAITKANVPPISSAPLASDQITYSNNTVTIPD
jgi:hydroxybutyrate-dimer hydrolase